MASVERLCYILLVVSLLMGTSFGRANSKSDAPPLQRLLTISPSSGSTFLRYEKVPITLVFQDLARAYFQQRGVDTRLYLGMIDGNGKSKLKLTDHMIALPHNPDSRGFSKINLFKNDTTNITLAPSEYEFEIDTELLGYKHYYIQLIEEREDNTTDILDSYEYRLTIVRRTRTVDLGFNIAITTLGILNIFAMGCVTDWSTIKEVAKRKRQLVLVTVSQYIILPMVVFGMVKVVGIQNEILLGFLLTACVPGGGLGHLIVSITENTDLELSVTLNFMQLIIPIGIVPIYVYSTSALLSNGSGERIQSIYYLVFWLVGFLVPYGCGACVRRRRQQMSDALLNWLIKPVLLLAFILFITLGLYINMYMFSVLDTAALVVAGLIPFVGFGISGGIMLIFKQAKKSAKTSAIESAILNSVVVIAALRFTLPQPDADLASASAMAILYFTPAPFVLMFFVHRCKRTIMSHFEKNNIEKEKQKVMLNSFATITQNAIHMGGLDMVEAQTSLPSPLPDENGDKSKLIANRSHNTDDSPHVIMSNISFTDHPPSNENKHNIE